jgi:SAM-dependent methyltransferase
MPVCRNCLHEHATPRYDFGREKIFRCDGCGLLYLDPWPSEEETQAVYGDSYFQNPRFMRGDNDSVFGYADYIAERFIKQSQYTVIARRVRELLPPLDHPPRLLEVGCGFGYFLDTAFEEGFQVTGMEFNRHAVERLRRKYAFPILSGALERTALDRGSFDAIAMFDVIEHLRDPFGALDRLHDALAPHGVLVVSTPDAESWVSRVIGKRLEDFRRTREHLFFFGRRTLGAVLDAHGFDVLALRSIGHTFEIAFLLDRLALYNRPLFTTLRRIVNRVGIGGLRIRVNPHTKMIAIARRRPRAAAAAGRTAAAPSAAVAAGTDS